MIASSKKTKYDCLATQDELRISKVTKLLKIPRN